MRKPVIIGAHTFPTKKEATGHIRRILYATVPGMPVAPEDHPFLLALVERHPHAVRKIGAGVLRFEVRPNPTYPGNYGFWIVRTDGSETDFSFVECLSPSTYQDDVRHAMRGSVADQIIEYKQEAFARGGTVYCLVTAEPVTWDTCHVDHAPPTFLELADRFAALKGGYEGIPLTDPSTDGAIGREIAEPGALFEWQEYHRRHARLRIVSPYANLGLLRRGKREEIPV